MKPLWEGLYHSELAADRSIDDQRMARSLNSLGIILLNRRELKKSRTLLEEAVRTYRSLATADEAQKPNLAIALNNLANVYERQSHKKIAIRLRADAAALANSSYEP